MSERARPVVGVAAYAARVPWPNDPVRAAIVPENYLDALSDGGGVPVVLPVGSSPEVLVARVDALVLLAGVDVDPARYGAPSNPATGTPSRRRDDADFAYVRLAIERGVPLLGICRGTQVMNVACGGTLEQHLPDLDGVLVHVGSDGSIARHTVRAVEGSRLASIVGLEPLDVASTHHQAVRDLAPGLTISARAEDGIIEAIERDDGPFFLGVQWHPEEDSDRRLFAALVDATRPEAATRPFG